MENIVIVGILILIVGGAIAYIVVKKKQGAVCVGCPCAGECGKSRGDSCGCASANQHSLTRHEKSEGTTGRRRGK